MVGDARREDEQTVEKVLLALLRAENCGQWTEAAKGDLHEVRHRGRVGEGEVFRGV